jgi:hypothetical protein
MARKKHDREEPDGGDYSSPEKPWDEARWEAEFRRNDARADRFGELLETFMDHPDRDELVAREMGWDDRADNLAEYKRAKDAGELDDNDDDDEEDDENADFSSFLDEADDDEEDDDDDDESWRGAGDDADDEQDAADLTIAADDEGEDDADADAVEDADDPFPEDDHDRELKEIPAYVMAHELGLKIDKLFKPYMKGSVDDDPSDGRFGEAWIGMFNAAVKISGGHSLGYDDEFLCGNIVKNKIALASVDKSIEAFVSLKADGLLPAKLVDQVLPEARKVRDAIAERVEELRKGVWW